MALDTRSKRLSAINIGSPWRSHLPIPDGTIDQGDRQHIGLWCSSVLCASSTAGAIISIGLGGAADAWQCEALVPNWQLEAAPAT